MNPSIIGDLVTASHLVNAVNGHDQFIREAVLEQGISLTMWLNSFLPSVKRQPGAEEELVELGKSDRLARTLAGPSFKSQESGNVENAIDFDYLIFDSSSLSNW